MNTRTNHGADIPMPNTKVEAGPNTRCKCGHKCIDHVMFDPGWCKICETCTGFEELR